MIRPYVLPVHELMRSVYVKTGEVRRSLLRAPFCAHPTAADFVLIDYRAGPGSFADNFEGLACEACGRVLSWRQTL